ncbi:MAG: 4Fe-4S dicluster domain-containing protein, partial [Deltaproteobacteria bacterium]|nr:4Fe-4S dicluster domain-containing protein [Deltaproteobacteria bacterium]
MDNQINLDIQSPTPLRDLLMQESQWRANLSSCMECGRCLSVCPLSGYEGFDPRKLVRQILVGEEQKVIENPGIFQCTGCDRCTYVCPMGVKIGNLI